VTFARNLSPHIYQEQEALWYLGGQRIIRALGERIPGGIRVTEFLAPARAHVFTYRPTEGDEALYAISGDATMTCGDLCFQAGAGALLFLPSALSHHLEVGSSSHFRYLTWMTPVGFAHDVTKMGIPGEALVLAPPPPSDRAKVQRLADLIRASDLCQEIQ
jgi:hypothetical protein